MPTRHRVEHGTQPSRTQRPTSPPKCAPPRSLPHAHPRPPKSPCSVHLHHLSTIARWALCMCNGPVECVRRRDTCCNKHGRLIHTHEWWHKKRTRTGAHIAIDSSLRRNNVHRADPYTCVNRTHLDDSASLPIWNRRTTAIAPAGLPRHGLAVQHASRCWSHRSHAIPARSTTSTWAMVCTASRR